MKKILFIVPHRKGRSPGQRFRFEQYIPYLEQEGFHCTYSPLLSRADDKIFYSEGRYLRKIFIFLKMFLKRWRDVQRAGSYDIIFIYREAFFTRTILFEKLFKKSGAKIVFDFDDAIWIPAISEMNKKFSWLKNPGKISAILPLTDLVTAGNSYLAGYAEKFASDVAVIPTTIDTGYHVPAERKNTKGVTIGWTGSYSTLPYFEMLLPVLEKIKNQSPGVSFRVICDKDKYYPEIDTKITQWKAENEIQELNTIDIGLMPLPDDKWSEGKCGFKALQYMALGIPAIVSPVGVNKKITSEGINGFHATSPREWEEKIMLLINNPELRKKLGEKGREKVRKEFSVNAWKEKYIRLFMDLL